MALTSPVNDPLFDDEWYLRNTGQANGGIGVDLDVVPAWSSVTGRGVRIAIVDDGVQLNHPDLAAHIDQADSYDSVSNTMGNGSGNPVLASDSHGTAVAGIAGAVGNNGVGTAGVAYDATLVAYRIPLSDEANSGEVVTDLPATARAFVRQLAANIDVSSNSWGTTRAFAQDWTVPNAEATAILALGTQGRNGLGTPIVVAAGNDRGINADAMLDNFVNSRVVIGVAALSNNGTAASYSSMGADLLVSAFGGGNTPGQAPALPGNATTTADRTGTDGYNRLPSPAGDNGSAMNGTSAATPMVSGVVALMLQAAPGLGYRDVQTILAESARLNDWRNTGWVETGAQTANGGGLAYNREYGFGLVDARAAVRMAETWQYVDGVAHTEANLQTVTATAAPGTPQPGTAIPPEPGSITLQSGLTVPFQVSQPVQANRVEVTLDLVDPNPETLVVLLTSPSGNVITLVSHPGNALVKSDTDVNGNNHAAAPLLTPVPWPSGGFTLDTPAFMTEQGEGRWTLQVIDDSPGVGAVFNSAQLKVLGDPPPAAKTYTFSDDFARIAGDGSARLSGYGTAGQTARLDAAAVSTGVTFDLSGARASSVEGRTLQLTPGAHFDQLIGGDGDDVLVGDGTGTLIYGGRGSDVIDGGVAAPGAVAGTSTAAFLDGRGSYVVTGTGDTVQIQSSDGSVDQLSHIGKLKFQEGTLNVADATDSAVGTAVLYRGLLGRAADAGYFQAWTQTGGSASDIGRGFLGSQEFNAGRGLESNQQFVSDLYSSLLDRSADAGGLAAWSDALQAGASRSDVALAFGRSAEFSQTAMTGLFSDINRVA